MQNNREVIAHQKQYCMINTTILSFQSNDIKNECVCLGNHSKIILKHQRILETQSCLKSILSIKKAYLLLVLYKEHLKCFISHLFFSSLLYYNNIIYNKYIISNTKIKKINLVIIIN
jgi:hypothetical protein